MKVLIVGGVAGGASAATRLRRNDEKAEIILFERGQFISYANCGLPYYIGGTIKEREKLVVAGPGLLKKRFRIDVRVKNEVVAIDGKNKTVTVKNHADGREYQESYDKLILSPGARPKILNIKGDVSDLLVLRNIPDTYKIDDFIKEKAPKTAAVIGGGFIGIEIAENLTKRGIAVTVIEFASQVMSNLDFEMAGLLHREMEGQGVKLIVGAGVSAVEKIDGKNILALTNDETVTADMVISAAGVTPDTAFAKEAGIALNKSGAIVVDEQFMTSLQDVYAVGDAIEVKRYINGSPASIPLAGPANKQGRMVADIISGKGYAKNFPVLGSSVIKVFDLTAASVGMSEKMLKDAGIPFMKVYAHPASHASYYPGGTQITMKMLFDKEGKILGAQAVGRDGVDKRIDVLATVIRLHGTVYDLEGLELCYAPPFSSAKDPVNMLGFIAANVLRGDTKVFYAEDTDCLDLEKAQLIDVSTKDEYMINTVAGAKNLPVDDLRDNLDKLDKEKPVYVFCQVGLRGYVASRILKANGFDAYNMTGGMKTYKLYHAAPVKKEAVCDCIGVAPAHDEKKEENKTMNENSIKIDACGLQCPGPIMKLSEGVKSLPDGATLTITATDPAFSSDVKVWCERTGNTLLSINKTAEGYEAQIAKGKKDGKTDAAPVSGPGNDKTMVVFSGDLDKAIASFIIANGAAAMGRKVTMFFTFWGLNILRKPEKVKVSKNFIEKCFGMMMPRGSKKLQLSKMNMGGAGSKMIRGIMKKKNVSSLEEFIDQAKAQGIKLIACQMSMDVMGIKPEELIDGVEIGGVATFLGSAETSDTNLFI